jgi:FixJ family two-component response regulator
MICSDRPIVLTIDNDARMYAATERLSKTVGLHSESFATPQDSLRHKLPDGSSCLVLDVRLPGMSGLEVQQKLNEAGVQIPIIFITGHGEIQQARKRSIETRQEQNEIARLKERYAKLTAREREVMRLIVPACSTNRSPRHWERAKLPRRSTVPSHAQDAS